jgi:hypothetical protein
MHAPPLSFKDNISVESCNDGKIPVFYDTIVQPTHRFSAEPIGMAAHKIARENEQK